MKKYFAWNLAALASILLGMTALTARGQSGTIVIDHTKVAAAFAKGMPLLETNKFKVQAGRREAPGEMEQHAADTDIFYVLEGTATLVTGGKPVEARTIAPGEVRARSIDGGETRQLVKGDIIVIPNGVPHWFKEVKGPFLYYVVKVTN